MDVTGKAELLALFQRALVARDADTANQVIEAFAAAGSSIAEVLTREFLDAGLGRANTSDLEGK